MPSEKDNYYKRALKFNYNTDIFLKYLEHLEVQNRNGKIGKASINRYSSSVATFIEKMDKPVEDIEIEQVSDFIDKRGSDNNKKAVLYGIKSFWVFVKTKKNVKFTEDSIDKLIKIINEQTTDEPEGKPKALELDDIVKIRNLIRTEEKYHRLLFAFDMVYLYGLGLNELVDCTKGHYNEKDHSFKINGKVVIVNDEIYELIQAHPKLLDKFRRESYQSYFERIGELIGKVRETRFSDIIKTREEYGIICPVCKNKYPNISEFWTLAERDDDITKTKWFVCKNCASSKEVSNNE